MSFKEIYCRDCGIVLAKFNIRYFSDNAISELVRVQYGFHIKNGHSVSTRNID
jgi:hypothetical protein